MSENAPEQDAPTVETEQSVPPPEGVPFDPADATATEVVAYLEQVTGDERARVLEAEAAGKARKTVLSWADAQAPEPDADGYTRVVVPEEDRSVPDPQGQGEQTLE